jgi:outer membrane protein OmpA-like peptidoglycan-associated protein
LLAGGGVDHIDSDLLNTYGGHALIGLKYALWTNVALRADAAQTWLGGGHGNSRAMHLGFSIFRQPTVRTEQITRYDPAPYRAYREDSVSAFETTRLRGVEVAYRGLRDSLMTDHPTASTFAAPSSLVALSTMREKIFFQRNRSELSDSAKKILDAKVVVFNANPALRIIITGYASLPGTDEKNRELGFRRAESAKAYLIARGIDPVRIEISSRGEENPAVEGSSNEANAANRRNQFRILIADPFLTEPKR